MGLPFLIAALVLNLNHTTWFSGENDVETALWWVGGALMALNILWFVFVVLIGLGATRKARRW